MVMYHLMCAITVEPHLRHVFNDTYISVPEVECNEVRMYYGTSKMY